MAIFCAIRLAVLPELVKTCLTFCSTPFKIASSRNLTSDPLKSLGYEFITVFNSSMGVSLMCFMRASRIINTQGPDCKSFIFSGMEIGLMFSCDIKSNVWPLILLKIEVAISLIRDA